MHRPKARYIKLRSGDWGVKIPNELSKGSRRTITVYKKDGTTKNEEVEIIWSGKGCSIGIPLAAKRKSRRRWLAKRRPGSGSFEWEQRRRIERERGIPEGEADWAFDAFGNSDEAADAYWNLD